MKISRNDVSHVAHLANLSLSEEEMGTYQQDLEKIFQSMDHLGKIDTKGVSLLINPVFEVIGNRQRDDVVTKSWEQRDVLSNAPSCQYGQFKINAVMESDS